MCRTKSGLNSLLSQRVIFGPKSHVFLAVHFKKGKINHVWRLFMAPKRYTVPLYIAIFVHDCQFPSYVPMIDVIFNIL